MTNKVKFEMGQEIFLSLEGGITKHILKGFFEVEGVMKYLTISFGKSVTMDEKTIFTNLEDAKKHAIEFINKKIEDFNTGTKAILASTPESIDLVPEVMPKPVEVKEEVSDNK